jgi:hypothetical protein
MSLYSLGFQTVRIDEQMFTFSAGEAMCTGISAPEEAI